MKERIKNSLIMFFAQKRLNSGLHLQDLQTLEIQLIPKQKLIIGLMKIGKFRLCFKIKKIDYGTKKTKTMKLKELRFTCYKDSLSVVMF